MISQCAEKGWDSMKPEEKYEHIFKCISEMCFDYFLSTKTQELLKVNIFQSNSFLTKRAYTDLVYAHFDYTVVIIMVL